LFEQDHLNSLALLEALKLKTCATLGGGRMTNIQKLTIKLILLISFVITLIMFLQDPIPQKTPK
jgi:hypothetical protein